MSKITYADKVALKENASISNTNKVTANDMNQIKSVVNGHDDSIINNTANIGNLKNLQTIRKADLVLAINDIVNRFSIDDNEKIVGKYNNKNLYRKTLTFNKSLSSGANTIAHNISNADVIFPDVSFCFFASSNRTTSIPCLAYNTSFTDRVALEVDKTNIILTCDSGWGTIWTKNITLLYTKTTD